MALSLVSFTACSSNSSGTTTNNSEATNESNSTSASETEAASTSMSESESDSKVESNSEELSVDDAYDKAYKEWKLESEIGLINTIFALSVHYDSVKNLNAASLDFVEETSDDYIFVVKGTFSAYDDYGNFVEKYNFDQEYKVSKAGGAAQRYHLKTAKS